MSEQITVLRDLQREYIEKRNHCYVLIRNQDNNLRNCIPSAYTIRACREREAALREEAAQHQKRIDAIQKKLDEAIGLTDE
jgi:septal ring factor EnvC (AmiA/AmiB activator)